MKLEGTWYNELHSKMVLRVDGAAVTGTYETAVGDARGPYPLVGRTEAAASGRRSVAFVVCWENEALANRCCTAWCGQLAVDEEGRAAIATTWLLRRDTDETGGWGATLVGQDLFRREPPARPPLPSELRRAPSHPLVRSQS